MGPTRSSPTRYFVRQYPTVRVFAIADLDDVRLVRSVAGGPSGLAVTLGFGLLGVAAVTWLKFGVSAATPLIVAAVVLAFVGMNRRGGHASEIRARYRAREVTLYISGDSRTFNQVARALRRTIERSRQRQSYGLAAG